MNIETVDSLIANLSSETPSTRWTAIKKLSGYRDERLFDVFVKMLSDENEYCVAYAVDALDQLGDVRAVEPLINALENGTYIVKKHTALIIGNFNDERVIPPLIETLGRIEEGDFYNKVQMSASTSLSKLGNLALPYLIQSVHTEMFGGNSARVYYAVKTLGYIGNPEALPILRQVQQTLRKPNPNFEDEMHKAVEDAIIKCSV